MAKTVNNVPGVGTVHFPDTMSDEQIEAAIGDMQRSPAAGFNERLQEQASQKAYSRNFDWRPAPNTLERIGRGAQDIRDRVSQLWVAAGEKMGAYPEGLGDVMTQTMNEEQAEYRKGIPHGDVDVGRIVGNIGATSPLALIPGGQTLWRSAGSGAVQGGGAGLLQYDETNSLEQGLKNTLTGAATGGVASPIAKTIASLGTDFTIKTLGRFKGVMERLKGKADPSDIIREIPEFGLLPKELRANLIIEAQEQIGKTGTLNVEQLARKANLIANDVTPTKSMVTRDPRDWSMERNLQKLSQSPDERIAGMGQELTGVYQANDAALRARLESFMAGLPKGTSEAQGMRIMQALDNLSQTSQAEVGKLYKMVREQSGDNLASDAKTLFKTLDDLSDSTYAEKLVGSVKNKLKRFGMIDKDGALTSNSLTVTQAEELRKFVNTLPNDFGKKDIIRAIDQDVLAGAGSDAFESARKAASQRFAMLDNPVTQKALNAYGELTQGKTAQNFIKAQVVDAAEQDVDTLLNTLSKLPEKEAEEAVSSMRAGVLEHLQSKAVNANSGQFSGAGLNTAMEKIGQEKLKKIFGSKMYDELRSLARAGLDATYQPPYAAVNHSNTAPMLLSLMQRARGTIGLPIPGINEAAERGAARIGYGRQLGKALEARAAPAGLPQIDPRVQGFIDLIRGAGAPASVAILGSGDSELDKRRKAAN